MHAESLGAFVLGEPSPDPIWFGDFQCVIQAVLEHWGRPGRSFLASLMRFFRADPRSSGGWKNVVLAIPRQAVASCQSQCVSWGPGNLLVSATVGKSTVGRPSAGPRLRFPRLHSGGREGSDRQCCRETRRTRRRRWHRQRNHLPRRRRRTVLPQRPDHRHQRPTPPGKETESSYSVASSPPSSACGSDGGECRYPRGGRGPLPWARGVTMRV
jgi:hypothetical protein